MDLLTSLELCPGGRKREMIGPTVPVLLRELKAMQYHLKLFIS